MKRLIIYSILSIVAIYSYGQNSFNKTDIKSIMKSVADWQIANPAKGNEHDDLNWTYAALYMGMIDWAELTEKEDKDSSYYEWLMKIGRRNAWQVGKYMYHADHIAVGQVFLDMYQKYHDRNMWLPTLARTEFVINHPSASTLELDYRNIKLPTTICLIKKKNYSTETTVISIKKKLTAQKYSGVVETVGYWEVFAKSYRLYLEIICTASSIRIYLLPCPTVSSSYKEKMDIGMPVYWTRTHILHPKQVPPALSYMPYLMV